jgi:hypothetical protein
MGLQFPKPRRGKRTRFIPCLPEDVLQWILGPAAPAERKALAQIVETSHVYRLEDGTEVLVTPATPALLERLAVFQAEGEDLEWDHEDSFEEDDDRDNDNAIDDPERDAEEEDDRTAPPPGATKAYENFVDRKREACIQLGSHRGAQGTQDGRWRDLRGDGFREVERIRHLTNTPARRPW